MSKIVDLSFWMDAVVPVVGGGVVAKIAASQLTPLVGVKYEGFARHAANLVASGLTGAVGFFITKDAELSAKLLAGGLVATLIDLLYGVAGKVPLIAATAPAMGDLDIFGADDLEKELEARIMKEVESGVSQYEHPSENVQLAQWPPERGTSAFVTSEEIAPEMAGVDDFVSIEAIR